MAKTETSPLLELIRRVVVDGRLSGCADQELLGRYLSGRDEAAFEAILRRHRPMVLDVCRGVLRDTHDVEDAFQVTFLVLARKAGSIRKAASLASWLHGVAYRVARKAQAEIARRKEHEARAPARSGADAADEHTWREVRQVVHEELGGFPERLRAPLVLCYLQGLAQDEAAAELGIPKGTLKGRLERGRALLRARLVGRGLGPGALLVLAAWPAAAARAGLSAGLVGSAVRSAAAVAAGRAASGPASTRVVVLATGVLRSMCLAKLGNVTAVVAALGVLGAVAGAGILALRTRAALEAPYDRPEASQQAPAAGRRPAAYGPEARAPGQEQPGEARRPAADLAKRTWAILEVVGKNHAQPPPRQDTLLKGALALLKGADVAPPEGLARRAAAVASEDGLRAFLSEIWPKDRPGGAGPGKLEAALLDGMFDSIPGRPRLRHDAAHDLDAQLRGNRYVGIGVQLAANEKEKLPQITVPFRRGAARKAGALPGDLLLEIDGKSTRGMPDVGKVAEMLRGAEGTTLTIVVRQPGAAETRALRLTRAVIPLDSVFGFRRAGEEGWDYRADPEARIAYVWVKSLKSSTLHELAEVERRLDADGMRGLVLDFRLSQGDGVLHDAGLVADGLIDGGLLWTARESPYPAKEWRADRECLFRDWPMVVLVNGVPDNAQGAVLAALQDRGRATLVGEPAKSDGAIRRAFPLPHGQGLIVVLTGQLERADKTRGWPVRPDQAVGLSAGQRSAVEKWLMSKQLPVLPPGADDRPPEDPQLAAGLAVLRERLKAAAAPAKRDSEGGE